MAPRTETRRGGTHEFLAWLASPGRRLPYSVGVTITEDM